MNALYFVKSALNIVGKYITKAYMKIIFISKGWNKEDDLSSRAGMRRVVLWNSAPETERYAPKASTADCRSRITVHLAGHGRFVYNAHILVSSLYKVLLARV